MGIAVSKPETVEVALRVPDSYLPTTLRLPRVLSFDELRRRVADVHGLPADRVILIRRGKTLCGHADISLRDGDDLLATVMPGYNSDEDSELNPDPRYGLSKEEVEWRKGRYSGIHQRMQKASMELRIQSARMRHHFLTDPRALKLWDEYEVYLQRAFTTRLTYKLSNPAETPSSVLYEHLMKKKAHPKPFAGALAGRLDKLKQAAMNNMVPRARAGIAGVAAAFAAGTVLGSSFHWQKQQQTLET